MSDLLDKLNVLVRARINSALSGGNTSGTDSARREDARETVRRDPREAERDVRDLRRAIEDALNAQDSMQTKLDAARGLVTTWDAQADDALLRGEDAAAREILQKMKRADREAATLAAELEKHQRSTSQLIEQVNELEAILADAQAQKNVAPAVTRSALPADAAPGETVSIPLRRDAAPPEAAIPIRVGTSAPKPTTSAAPPATPAPQTTQEKIQAEVDKAQVEDDLARRRSRLSKPGE